MCGIVGVAGSERAQEIVLTGLQRLEYRGYDSAGLAVLDAKAKLHTCKAVGKLAALQTKLADFDVPATAAIGHTRWATHGEPTEANAHPHVADWQGYRLAVVHNGIIENHAALRVPLLEAGAKFLSETDTEVLPFAVAELMASRMLDLPTALAALLPTLHGSFALAFLQEGHPDTLVATRRGAPLCVGLGEGVTLLASDPYALAGETESFIYLQDDDVALLTPAGCTIWAQGQPVQRPVQRVDLSTEAAGKHGYRHFMLKEIHDQPHVVQHILSQHTDSTGNPTLPVPARMLRAPAINIIGCGTAYYAAQVGKSYLEQLARVPVNVDMASEFRYRKPPLVPEGLFIAVSQSGETADTLAALEYAKAQGQQILVLTNVPTSSMARAADAVVPLLAGREIAVASTKAFLAMVLNLLLLAVQAGRARDLISASEVHQLAQAWRELPIKLEDQLGHLGGVQELADQLANMGSQRSLIYLGRGLLAPLAYEGALKLKEISYLHAEAYPSGEMKHGPIALVEPGLPVINLAASQDGLFEKTISNLQEIAARRGEVILLVDEPGVAMLDAKTKALARILTVPTTHPLLLPLVFAVPMQLLAYFTAVAKGTDVDQPRNLAKSVTVE